MRIAPGAFDGVFLLDVEPREDERGFFARTFCADEVSAFGMNNRVAQVNLSFNRRQGTLRGLHFQKAPHGETKIVRCTRGRVFDVIVDLRRGSPTFRQWEGIELSESSRRSIYIPLGFAHGFLTLTDNAELMYLMGSPQVAAAAAGYRYDDPAFGIRWPEKVAVVSPRDLAFPSFDDAGV
jgi:dTDP-4-dehydrorhamnose 3,5-epimerase